MARHQNNVNAPSGLLLVDKPGGMTSHDVVDRIRRVFGTRKVGHGGTLDPLATGLLMLCVGASTKLVSYISGGNKRYTATIKLGITTDTDDIEGAVLSQHDVPEISQDILEDAVSGFIGEIEQRPPAYSAIKIDGKRAYARARAGEKVDVPLRNVHIEQFNILKIKLPRIFVRVHCSGGTYVRSLARDLGEQLGVGGTIEELRRTGSGPFSVERAVILEELMEKGTQTLDSSNWLSPGEALKIALGPPVVLEEKSAQNFVHGQTVMAPVDSRIDVPVVAHDGKLLGIGEQGAEGRIRPRRILATAST